MKTANIEEQPLEDLAYAGSPEVIRMFQPEISSQAEMISGSSEEIADQLVNIFRENGIL